jgi:structural maintenance of chromosome 3 (chondroitin sulfate proteoglycan 6)
LKDKIELVTVEREQQESDKRESHKAKTQVELLIKDLEEASTRNVRQRETLQADLEALQTEIEEKEEELEALEPRYQATLTQETAVRTQLEQAEAKQKTLYDKQGRASQFRTQKERDAFLRKEIDKDKAFLSNRERALDDSTININNAKETVETKKAKEAEIREELENRKDDMAKWNDELRKITKQRNEVDERKKEMWRDESSSARLAESAKLQLAEAEKTLYHTMDRVR